MLYICCIIRLMWNTRTLHTLLFENKRKEHLSQHDWWVYNRSFKDALTWWKVWGNWCSDVGHVISGLFGIGWRPASHVSHAAGGEGGSHDQLATVDISWSQKPPVFWLVEAVWYRRGDRGCHNSGYDPKNLQKHIVALLHYLTFVYLMLVSKATYNLCIQPWGYNPEIAIMMQAHQINKMLPTDVSIQLDLYLTCCSNSKMLKQESLNRLLNHVWQQRYVSYVSSA